jgi:HrpA-like RNA helicase
VEPVVLEYVASIHCSHLIITALGTDGQDKNWAWNNYLAARALAQADNVRSQLQRNMEKSEIDLISISDTSKLYKAVRMALVCGFFMQVAHKEGEKGNYLTVKDNQVCWSLNVGYIVSVDIFVRWSRCTRRLEWKNCLSGCCSTSLC